MIHEHANIHKALKYAVKMDLIPFNPADKVERPKKQKYTAVKNISWKREMIQICSFFSKLFLICNRSAEINLFFAKAITPHLIYCAL